MVEVVRLGRDAAPGGKKVKGRIRKTEKKNEYAHERIHKSKYDREFKNGDQGSFCAFNISQDDWDRIFRK